MSSLSLLVPCYNASAYIEKLAAVVAETSVFLREVLLVDDCSTDDSFQRALALGLPVVQTPYNMGPGGARNFGVEFLCGEWVHFLDADDVLSVETLYNSLRYLNETVDVLLVGARWVHEITGEVLKEWAIHPQDVALNPLLYSLSSPIPTHCSILRIEQFRTIGGFDPQLRCWEDGDLHVRLAAHGSRFSVMDGILTTSIRHDRGASANHLYCHRCRLAFLKRYGQQELPIEPAAMSYEFLSIGNLLLGERCYLEALDAFRLAHRARPIQPRSNRPFVRRVLALLPAPLATFLQQWLRQTLGQYFRAGL